MADICADGRFEIIKRAKEALIDSTNITDSPEEMKVLDNFLFRCWQMGWLDKYGDDKKWVIELPCAIGDTVYTIPRSKPRRWKVVYIGICGDGRHYMNIAWYKDHHNFETRSVYFDEIGKTVFLTQEDAEAELERRRNERNNQN